MKKLIKLLSAVIFAVIAIAACNKYYSAAISDIKKNQITNMTILNLEKASQNDKAKVSSYYQLAKVYHYDQQYRDIDKAKYYYQKLTILNNDPKYRDQFDKLREKEKVDASQISNRLNDVEILIDNRIFNEYVKTNTIDGYYEYVKNNPYGKHCNEAGDKAFNIAKKTNTNDTYLKLLKLFPSYETTAKDRAILIAKQTNTIAGYTEYLEKFGTYRSNEIEQFAYDLIYKNGKLDDMNEYLTIFPYGAHKDDVIRFKEITLFKEFVSNDNLDSKSFTEKVTSVDNYLSKTNVSSNNKNLAWTYSYNNMPNCSTLNDLTNLYNDIRTISFKTAFMDSIIWHYYEESVLNYVNGDETLPNAVTIFDGGDYSTGWDADKTQKLKEESNLNFTAVSKTLQERIGRCNKALSSFPQISDETKDLIRERINRDNLFIAYYPVKHFYDRMDYQSYDKKTYEGMSNKIRAIKSNSDFLSCSNWDKVSQILDDTQRKISTKQNEAVRIQQIAENSIISKWKTGHEICNNVSGGIIYGTIEQFNDDRSAIQMKILAGPSGTYDGQEIKKGNTIWIHPNTGWHRCLPDEKEYALSHNSAKSINEPQVVYQQQSTPSGPKICNKCGGRGRQVCSSCNGTGISESWGGDRDTCSSCRGSGYVKCYGCNGRGVL